MTKVEIKNKVDALIKKMNQVKQMQKDIGMNIISDEENVLIYNADDLLEYADALRCVICANGYVSSEGNIHIGFTYKGYEFVGYVTPQKHEQIKEKVLPPTKVTEPIQNNE